jgi:hypothetical protein
VLPGNRVQASPRIRGRRVIWQVRAGGTSLGPTPAPRGHAFSLRLDAGTGTVSAEAGGQGVRRRMPLVAERTARIVLRSRRLCRATDVSVSVGRRPASAPSPAARPVAISVGSPSTSTRPPATSGGGARSGASRPFSADSVWNQALAPDAALDARSTTYVADLNRQIAETAPYINTTQYSTPVYTVPSNQPTVRVTLDRGAQWNPLLVQAWAQVPIPPNAQPAAGSDANLVVWQPETDTMWEFWRASRQADGWHASWGGRMEHVSASPGYYPNPSGWGAPATGLALLGGLVRLDELAAGHIDHALAIAIPQPRANWFSWPAQRTDGTIQSESAIPEGTRFRLDPRLNLSAMNLSPLVRMLAQAAQRYGIVVRDRGGAVTFFAEDPTPTGSNPYAGPNGYFAGTPPYQLMKQFPWQHLQALRTQLSCC